MPIEPRDDGLALPEVGQWAKRKYHFVGRYLDAFTTSMREKWPELHYVDLFAGAGFAKLRDSSELVCGCAVMAANVKHPFTQLHLCDADQANVHALSKRLEGRGTPCQPIIIHGDSNRMIDELLRGIPRRDALCVTVADPFGLHLSYSTIKKVADCRSDLIVLVPDAMDAVRNWREYYKDDPSSNLDQFLGDRSWREQVQAVPSERVGETLLKFYKQRLGLLGYDHFESERVTNSSGARLYLLLYASRSSIGAKIWRGISKTDEQGQRVLFPD